MLVILLCGNLVVIVAVPCRIQEVKMAEAGVLLGMGNPLLDISAVVEPELLEK
jgi:hypothetical protein